MSVALNVNSIQNPLNMSSKTFAGIDLPWYICPINRFADYSDNA